MESYRPWLFPGSVYPPDIFQLRRNSYRPWLFPGSVYRLYCCAYHSHGYRPWLFPGSVYPQTTTTPQTVSYRPWLFPGSVYLKSFNCFILRRYRPWLFPGSVYLGLKTSLCNKVLYCEVYSPYSLTRVRVIFYRRTEDLNSALQKYNHLSFQKPNILYSQYILSLLF